MAFCCMCGSQLNEQDKFCTRCGTPSQVGASALAPVANASFQQTALQNFSIEAYSGNEQRFILLGNELVVPSGMDVFNNYRKLFREFARYQAAALEAEYRSRIYNLDAFLVEFPAMYAKYRQPILDCAMSIMLKTGVYDVSAKQFEEQHTADFCLCGEDVDVMIESFNLTIEANQQRKARMYNMMPGVVFSGIGGFAAALAMNVAVNSIAAADIRNANVTPKQRAELFARINTEILMERAFTDYWRVFLSLTWQLNRKGINVWYPNQNDNESAKGLFQNLTSGMLPQEKIPELLVKLIQLNPYADDPLTYIRQYVGITQETARIFDYFGVE